MTSESAWTLAREARIAPRSQGMPYEVSLLAKVLLGGVAILVLCASYPWLWWQDRHVRRRMGAR
jgi:hypothetical protein